MAELLKRTVLHAAHGEARGRMVGFGGYDMPVQYSGEGGGVLAEHRWTREHAGLFDVSHMGPSRLRLRALSGDGQADHEAVAMIMETLVCGDIRGLKPGQL
ncbi:MAG: glycine cleavage system protein T, partial [Caulobacteraceae bacterium]|nr:glycine cleavage system protein T [Caulobacter sp.]